MGRRQERRKRKQRLRRKRSLFGLCVLAVLCAGYLLACTMVDKNTIVDRVAGQWRRGRRADGRAGRGTDPERF